MLYSTEGSMFEKDLSLNLLFDTYGELLPENQRDMFEQYYCDDLSLSEIAENAGRTRQDRQGAPCAHNV